MLLPDKTLFEAMVKVLESSVARRMVLAVMLAPLVKSLAPVLSTSKLLDAEPETALAKLPCLT